MQSGDYAELVNRELTAEIARQGKSKRDVAIQAGIKPDRLYWAMKNNSLRIIEYMQLAHALGIQPDVFITRARGVDL